MAGAECNGTHNHCARGQYLKKGHGIMTGRQHVHDGRGSFEIGKANLKQTEMHLLLHLFVLFSIIR